MSENDRSEVDDFKSDDPNVQSAVNFLLGQKKIGPWVIDKVIGAGANGVVAKVLNEKTKEKAVMKVALSTHSARSLIWESEVMGRIGNYPSECKLKHLVQRMGAGMTSGKDTDSMPYLVMEMLPGNPVSVIGTCVGDELTSKVCEYGLQLLKALYDMHSVGFLHRDIKPENLGMYNNEILVMYDLGMARAFTDRLGRLREPRSDPGMRGTDEWASLSAELGKEQGPVDDLWGWFYVMIEWFNCTSRTPQAWSAYEAHAKLRHVFKSAMFPAYLVLRNCPVEFYYIHMYLRNVGRSESPNYFYLAHMLNKAKKKADENLEEEKADAKPPEKPAPVPSNAVTVDKLMDKIAVHRIAYIGF